MNQNSLQAYQYYKAKMKYKDIANKLNVSVSTVKSWKTRHWNKWDEHNLAVSNIQNNRLCMGELIAPNV